MGSPGSKLQYSVPVMTQIYRSIPLHTLSPTDGGKPSMLPLLLARVPANSLFLPSLMGKKTMETNLVCDGGMKAFRSDKQPGNLFCQVLIIV